MQGVCDTLNPCRRLSAYRCGCCFICSVHWPFVLRFWAQCATLHAKFCAKYFPPTVPYTIYYILFMRYSVPYVIHYMSTTVCYILCIYVYIICVWNIHMYILYNIVWNIHILCKLYIYVTYYMWGFRVRTRSLSRSSPSSSTIKAGHSEVMLCFTALLWQGIF